MIRSGIYVISQKLRVLNFQKCGFWEIKWNVHFNTDTVQREGKGEIYHKDEIENHDIKKLYLSVEFNVNSPVGLLGKVWFEICLHFCRRGRENQRDLTLAMFDIKQDDQYVFY